MFQAGILNLNSSSSYFSSDELLELWSEVQSQLEMNIKK